MLQEKSIPHGARLIDLHVFRQNIEVSFCHSGITLEDPDNNEPNIYISRRKSIFFPQLFTKCNRPLNNERKYQAPFKNWRQNRNKTTLFTKINI